MLVSLGVTRERSRLGSGVEVIEIAISHEINRTGMQVWLYPSTTIPRVGFSWLCSDAQSPL